MKATNKKEQLFENKTQQHKQGFDSETYESSKKDVDLGQKEENMKDNTYKKSIDFFPKKLNIEQPDENEYRQRKYTLQSNIKIKDFVPQIKPLKINIIPSKLRLNKKGFKDLKRNKNNKILLNTKKYFISCPNLEDEESDKNNSSKEIYNFCRKSSVDICNDILYEDKKENIENTRKNFQKIKKNIPKVLSKNNTVLKHKYDKDLNLGNSSESDLYDIDELNNYSFNENLEEEKNEKKEEQELNNKGRNRFNSWSILDVLQKKYKLEYD